MKSDVHKTKPETHLPVEEQTARKRRAAEVTTPGLPGTRPASKRVLHAPRARKSVPLAKPQA